MNSTHITLLSFLFVAVLTGVTPCKADEPLPPIEHGDRFAYWVFLKAMNLQVDASGIPGKSDFYELYTDISYSFTASKELAIMTLERSSSPEAYRGLAYMALLELDGSVSEAHTCAVLKKGKAIVPYLEEARRARATGQCVIKEDFEVKLRPGLCRSSDDAKATIGSLVNALKKNETCNEA